LKSVEEGVMETGEAESGEGLTPLSPGDWGELDRPKEKKKKKKKKKKKFPPALCQILSKSLSKSMKNHEKIMIFS